MPGNPLGAAVKTMGSLCCSVSESFFFPTFNRVLGVASPLALDGDVIDEIRAFYTGHGVTHYRIEIPQPLLSPSLTPLLERKGLAVATGTSAKSVCALRALPELVDGVRVRMLAADDRDAFVEVNRRAWGLPRAYRSWLSGSFAIPGLRHFGVEVEGGIEAVGSLYVTGKMGWIGYDAVHPAHQGHRYQRAIIIARMHHARSLGCELLHVETMSEAQGEFSPSLRSMLGSGFNYVYDRSYFEPVEVGSP